MEVRAKLGNLRIAPRKVRLVADLIRRKKAAEALTILNFTAKKSSKALAGLINSALANAKNNFQIETDNLFISKIIVDEGPKYKRWMPRARGSAYEIQKKTSHITLILDEAQDSKKKTKKKSAKKEIKETEAAGAEKLTNKAIVHKDERHDWKVTPKAEVLKPKINKGIRKFFQRKTV